MNDLLSDGLDPRPDLIEDHRLWVVLLQVADEMYPNTDVRPNLNGFRCMGARLNVTDKGMHMIGGLGEYSEEEYAADRKEYLMPIEKELRAVFAEASKRVGGRNASR